MTTRLPPDVVHLRITARLSDVQSRLWEIREAVRTGDRLSDEHIRLLGSIKLDVDNLIFFGNEKLNDQA